MTVIRRITAAVMCCVVIFAFGGCGKSNKEKVHETSTAAPEKTVAVNAGDIKVYLDEAKYYLYTAQATYETYYISEGKEIDWESDMKDGTSWQQGIKSIVIDDICRRESMYALAGEYNVSLTEEEKSDVETDVKNYYTKTNKKLSSKIDISQKRLTYVFEKQKIAQKVESILNTTDKNFADETYETWKTGNTVTAEEQWKKITFSEHIFTLEDIK